VLGSSSHGWSMVCSVARWGQRQPSCGATYFRIDSMTWAL
jgi:hypothetical protein